MIQNNNSKQKNQNKKILVMGLDNSGKSSIILQLIGKNSLPHVFSINPTKGLNITNLDKKGKSFNIWELGGEETYINEHLNNFKKYIIDTEEIFFVIDVLDFERYERSLTYLENILQGVIKTDSKPEITIFLHKFDPDVEKLHPNLTDEKVNNLVARIKNLIPSVLFYEIYKTNIHTTLDRSHIL